MGVRHEATPVSRDSLSLTCPNNECTGVAIEEGYKIRKHSARSRMAIATASSTSLMTREGAKHPRGTRALEPTPLGPNVQGVKHLRSPPTGAHALATSKVLSPMPDETESVTGGSALPLSRDTNLGELLPAEVQNAPEWGRRASSSNLTLHGARSARTSAGGT
jgi:hypothetical protein